MTFAQKSDRIITAKTQKTNRKKTAQRAGGDHLINYIKTTLEIEGTLTAKAIDADRFAIYLNGDYFGIFDTRRKTFID